MTVSRVFSRAQLGMQAPLVTIEVHLSNGLPAFTIVGLPEKAVKETNQKHKLKHTHYRIHTHTL